MKSCLVMSVFLVAAALALAALAFLLIQASPATEDARRAGVAAEATRTAQDMAERQKRAEQNDRLMDAWIPAAQAAGAGVILAVPVAAGLAGWAFLRHRARHHGEFVHAGDGIPLPRARLLSGAYDDAIHADTLGRRTAEIEQARNPVHTLPANLRTYAPKFGHGPAPRPTAGQDAPPALAAPPTSLRDSLPAPMPASLLLRAGYRPTAERLLLGMGNGAPVWTPAACHVAVCGPTGAGKDVTSRFLLAQVVAAVPNAKGVILDPHHVWKDGECDLTPLQAAGVEAIEEKVDIAGYLEWLARSELPARIGRRRTGQALGPPTFVLLNEAPAVLADFPDVSKHVKTLVNESRKFSIYLLVASQDFLSVTIRETSIRAQLTTVVNLGADAYTARALGVVPPVDAGPLGKGVGYVRTGQDAPQLARLPMFDADAPRLLLPAPSAGPRNDSASWATSTTYTIDGEPVLRVSTPVDGRPDGRTVDAAAADLPQAEPTPTPSDRPTVRPPTTLTAKARAAGMPLTEAEQDLLSRVDRGQSPQTIARETTGQDGGRRYSRVRDEVARLADMVRNWPDGEQWSNGSEGEE